MQLFSANTTMFSFFIFHSFLPMKTWKNWPKNLLITGPNLFFLFSNANRPKSSSNFNSCSKKISHRAETLLAYDLRPKSYFFRNKTFLFFKNNFISIRQQREKTEIKIVWLSWMSWNFEILFQIGAENFSFLFDKQKSFIPKTNTI